MARRCWMIIGRDFPTKEVGKAVSGVWMFLTRVIYMAAKHKGRRMAQMMIAGPEAVPRPAPR